jgi:molybdopterin biosynthesis enzyme MoaB
MLLQGSKTVIIFEGTTGPADRERRVDATLVTARKET